MSQKWSRGHRPCSRSRIGHTYEGGRATKVPLSVVPRLEYIEYTNYRFSLTAFFSSPAPLKKPKRGPLQVGDYFYFYFIAQCPSILELSLLLLKIPPSFIFLFCL